MKVNENNANKLFLPLVLLFFHPSHSNNFEYFLQRTIHSNQCHLFGPHLIKHTVDSGVLIKNGNFNSQDQ